MPTLIGAVATLTAFLRGAFHGRRLVLGAVAAADWAVRTRRLNPFGALARFPESARRSAARGDRAPRAARGRPSHGDAALGP
jgi:hypothetical protein